MTTFGFGTLSVHAGKHSRLLFHASGSCSKSPSSVSCSCTWRNVKVHTLHVLASVIISGTHKPNTWLYKSQNDKQSKSKSKLPFAVWNLQTWCRLALLLQGCLKGRQPPSPIWRHGKSVVFTRLRYRYRRTADRHRSTWCRGLEKMMIPFFWCWLQ